MAIETDSNITWSELISKAEENLRTNIENLSGNTIPDEFRSDRDIWVSSTSVRTQQRTANVTTYGKSNSNWTNVSWDTVKNDFHAFLHSKNLDTNDRADQLVSTRLILNFFENLSLFYTNRLILVYSPLGNKPKKLYYYNNGSSYSSWTGSISNIESPVQDIPTAATDVKTLMTSIDANLKNKVKTYEQSYTFTTACSSCCCSCSSSSSSSSSCWTIIHQDLSLL